MMFCHASLAMSFPDKMDITAGKGIATEPNSSCNRKTATNKTMNKIKSIVGLRGTFISVFCNSKTHDRAISQDEK